MLTEFSHLGQKRAHFKITILLVRVADRIQSLEQKWAHFQISTLQDHHADRIQSFGTKIGTNPNYITTSSYRRQDSVNGTKMGKLDKPCKSYELSHWNM